MLTARYCEPGDSLPLQVYEPKPKVWTQEEIDRYIEAHDPDRVAYYTEFVKVGEQEVTWPVYNNDGSLFRSPTIRKFVNGTESIHEHRKWRVSHWVIPGGGTIGIKELFEVDGVRVL